MNSEFIEKISKYLLDRKDSYEELQKEIILSIDGRICHHKVRIINALIENMENPSCYVEIGVHNGTSMSYAVSTSKKMSCYGIDLFEESKNTKYSNDNLQQNRTFNNILKNNQSNSCVELIKGDSTNIDTYNKLLEKMNNQKADLLFIDGNHTYEYVKKDFEIYSQIVKKDGFIILDDYEPRYPGILKFAKEIDFKKFEKIMVYDNNELILRKKH